MTAILDPDLYGPPTVFQWAREQLTALRDEVMQRYRKAGERSEEMLRLYPDHQGAKESLVELDRAARRHLDAISKPFIDILMFEPCATMFVVHPDGRLELIDERVPMMGEWQPIFPAAAPAAAPRS